MRPRVGIVGARDLVDLVVAFRSAVPQAELVEFPYEEVAETPRLVTEGDSLVDCWLFTDPLAHHRAQSATTRPTACLDYGGSTLLGGLVRLMSQGTAVTHLSIDCLSPRDVQEVLAEAGVPPSEVRVFIPGPSGTAEEIAEVHLGFKERGYTALTCVQAVSESLAGMMPVFRLTPSAETVRTALNELVLTTTNQVNLDAQVVVGLLRCGPVKLTEAELSRIENTLGAIVSTQDSRTHLIVTTRRGIVRASSELALSPFSSMGPWAHQVHCGFGIGQSAPEALKLAGRALQRAETHAAPATVVSLRHDSDILLQAETEDAPQVVEVPSVSVVAAHSGLSVSNILRLQKLARSDPSKHHTTRDIADALNVEMRTARRLVHRLEQAGYAERVGQLPPSAAGRPLTLYDIAL